MSGTLLRKILFGLLALLVIIQFFRIDKENPPLEPEKDLLYLHTPSASVATRIQDACYDCHSNETKYPWYTNIAPVSWWIKGHINHGRDEFNMSTFGDYDAGRGAHKMEEAAEEVKEGHMPLPSYLWGHREAKLTDAEREEIAAYFTKVQKEIEAGQTMESFLVE